MIFCDNHICVLFCISFPFESGTSNCTNDGLSSLNPKMPSYLFIADQISADNVDSAQVFCKDQKVIGGPVNSTFENGIFFLACGAENKSWIQPALWPSESNCVLSNKTCTKEQFPSTPGNIDSMSNNRIRYFIF